MKYFTLLLLNYTGNDILFSGNGKNFSFRFSWASFTGKNNQFEQLLKTLVDVLKN